MSEAGLTRKEMRITNAPSKQNEVGEQAVAHWSVESVNVKCGRSALLAQLELLERLNTDQQVVGSNPTLGTR